MTSLAAASDSSTTNRLPPKRRERFVQTPLVLTLDQELSDAAYRLHGILYAKSWKTGTAKMSMGDLVALTGWSESKIRRARQELAARGRLYIGSWKHRSGAPLGNTYRLLEPGDTPSLEADPPSTGEGGPCHQRQGL